MKLDFLNDLRKTVIKLAFNGDVEPDEVARRLSALGIALPPEQLTEIVPLLISRFSSRHHGVHLVPPSIIECVKLLLDGQKTRAVCDPNPGFGEMLIAACDVSHADKAIAFARRTEDAALGRLLAGSAEWRIGDPIELLSSLEEDVDVFASILPFGARLPEPVSLTTKTGEAIRIRDDLGHFILASAALRLSGEGVGVFVVTPSFFFSEHSVFKSFPTLGLGLEAALQLPAGTFAPDTNIQTYLVVVRNQPSSRLFVGQLSIEEATNHLIIQNYKQGTEGSSVTLGRFVDPLTFTGLDSVRAAERLGEAHRKYGGPPVRLGDIATMIVLGRHQDDFEFPSRDNSIFVPLVGSSDVTDSPGDLTLKKQYYAQVTIDPSRFHSRFVVRFLNSEFGRELRELNKSGTIPRLNRQGLTELRLFVPNVKQQKAMLELEAKIALEQNTLLGLQAEITELRRGLWSDPRTMPSVERRLAALSERLSGCLEQRAAERLDQWFETLPFPLASILRAWQAAPAQDFKSRYEHLLHFFEATAAFLSVIFLSAFGSNDSFFGEHKIKLVESMQRERLSLQKASFGAWKLIVEYLGKKVREMLGGKKEDRDLCGELFSDPSLALPMALSNKALLPILSATNKMRNNWSGHGGIVGPEEARLRNEQLLGEVQQFREATADVWSETQLIRAIHCLPRKDVFENEVAILTGSNSEFLKETRALDTWLDVEELYLSRKGARRPLRLLPLVRVGSSPQSALNACYFFNRLERDGARFVSYHFIDEPERIEKLDPQSAANALLTGL